MADLLVVDVPLTMQFARTTSYATLLGQAVMAKEGPGSARRTVAFLGLNVELVALVSGLVATVDDTKFWDMIEHVLAIVPEYDVDGEPMRVFFRDLVANRLLMERTTQEAAHLASPAGEAPDGRS